MNYLINFSIFSQISSSKNPQLLNSRNPQVNLHSIELCKKIIYFSFPLGIVQQGKSKWTETWILRVVGKHPQSWVLILQRCDRCFGFNLVGPKNNDSAEQISLGQ